jgi:hypothetical protein
MDIRPLRKLASGSGVRGTYGAEDRRVFNIYEFSGTGGTKQSAAEVEFPERSILKRNKKNPQRSRSLRAFDYIAKPL